MYIPYTGGSMSTATPDAPMTRVVQALIDLTGRDTEALLRALVEVSEDDEAMFATIREADPLARARIRGFLSQYRKASRVVRGPRRSKTVHCRPAATTGRGVS
jgi:hypothetical protein